MELDGPIPTPDPSSGGAVDPTSQATPPEGAPDRSGSWVLGRFQLRRAVRGHPRGELWLGRERDTRRSVVVRLATDAADVERVRRAGAALSRIHAGHPGGVRGVVGLLASEPAPDASVGHVLVTEHVEGATLGKVLWWTRFTPPRAVAVVLDLCAAVRGCHAAGVIVGGADPEGVLVGRDDRGRETWWLAGFEGAPAPAHAAPEVLAGDPADERTDVYGLGLLLYRLLAGRWPFEGRDEVVVAAQLGAEPPPIGQSNPRLRLPPGLEALVLRCLAKAPAERYASVAELESALRPLATVPQRDWVVATGSEATLISEEPHDHHEPEPRPSPGWLVVPVALFALVTWWAASGG